jgi:uncharacterized protein (TIGR03067 family)
MDPFMTAIVSNIALATALAGIALAVSRLCRRPQLAHVLWMLVLIKLITPPVVGVQIPTLRPESRVEANFVADPIEQDYESPAIDVGGAISNSTTHDRAPRIAAQEAVAEDSLVHTPPLTANLAETSVEPPSAVSVLVSDVAPLQIAPPPKVDDGASPAPPSWRGIAYSVWLVGAVAIAAVFISRYRNVGRLLAQHPAVDPHLTGAAQQLARQMGLARCPSVCVVDARVPPLVWGLSWRPVIVLPQSLLEGLDPAQRDAVLAHELAHILRRDHLVRWLEVLVLVPFWFNPLAWWSRRELRRAEEECCDAHVVWLLPESRRIYGRALLKTLEFLSPGTPAASAAGSAFGKPFFKRRIEMILKRKMRPKLSWAGWGVIVLLAVFVIPVGAQTDIADEVVAESDAVATSEDSLDAAGVAADPTSSSADDIGTATEAKVSDALSADETPASGDRNPLLEAQDREAAERARFAGTWNVAVMKQNGRPSPSQFQYYRWYFDADESKAGTAWKRIGGDAHETEETRRFRFVVNPDASPKELTIYGDNMLIQAIYRWEGDGLSICFYGRSEKDRPEQFPAAGGRQETASLPVIEFKLVKDDSAASVTYADETDPYASADDVAQARERLRYSEGLANKGYTTQAQLDSDRFALRNALEKSSTASRLPTPLEALEARRAQAQADYRRVEQLAQRRLVSESEVDRSRAEFHRAQADANHAAVQREAEGQLLELDVAEAKVKLESAQTMLSKMKEAHAGGAVTDHEVEKQVLDLELARIALQRAEIKLKLHRQQNGDRQ